MTVKHTPEPWVIDSRVGFGDRFYSDDETGSIIGECPEYRFAPRPAQERFANVRRIVACVNACRGLPTDELEQKGLVAAVGTQLLEADQQRDELLEALESLFHEASQQNLRKANDVIAKFKGGKG